MWESVALTLAGAAGNSIGKVLQKKGTLILPPLSFKLKVIRGYALNRLWISGFLLDMCGAALMLTALSQAPVSVVQPIAGCGLAILCVFSHFYLKEVMNGLDWIAITMAGLGTIGIGVGGEEQKVEEIPLFSIPWLVLAVVILFVLLNTWLHIYKKQRREQELTGPEVIEEVIYGLESGILFGISSVISKMGFVMSEMGFPKIVVPAAISCSVACSAVGFVYQTRGLKHGRAIVVSTCTSVASIVSGVVAGMVALDEHLPTAPAGRFFLLLGWEELCGVVGGDSGGTLHKFTYIADAAMIGNTGGGREPPFLYGTISLIDLAAVGPSMPKSGDGCASKAQGAPPLHCTRAAVLRGLYQLNSSRETVTASSMLWESRLCVDLVRWGRKVSRLQPQAPSHQRCREGGSNG